MQEVDFSTVKTKIIGGVFALTTRTFILQAVSFVSTFLLTILLSPSIFGVFFVVSAVISFLSYFSDIGLAAALIQKKKDPSSEELKTVFTIQQALVGTLIIVAFLLSPFFVKIYRLDSGGLFLLQSLLISFFFSSLKTIPSVLLERRLNFELLIIPQILETLSFYLVTIILAFKGFGIASFAWAALIRGLIGLVAIYLIRPWRIEIGISRNVIKDLLSFGIPFQINSILALVKDDLMTIFLGIILPFAQIGYIGWAKKWAEAPLRLIMDSIVRVTFPAYSRLQENKVMLGKALAKSFFFLAVFIFPITFLLVINIQPMIDNIPKYLKWEPALLSFYLFAFSSLLASFSSSAVNALNAIGKIKTTLVLMVFWLGITWLLVPFFVLIFGYNGVAMAAFIISFTACIPIILIRKQVYFHICESVIKPFLATLVMGIVVFLMIQFNRSIFMLICSSFMGIALYTAIIWFWTKEEIRPYLPKFLQKMR